MIFRHHHNFIIINLFFKKTQNSVSDKQQMRSTGISNKRLIYVSIIFICGFIGLSSNVYGIGTTFPAEQTISNSNGESTIPQIATQGNNVFLVWRDIDTTNTDPEVLFVKSSDNGANFGSIINITSTLSAATVPVESTTPQIATSENFVYIIWQDETGSNDSDIYLATSSNSGDSFGSPINISAGSSFTGIAQNAKIATSGSNVYVAWEDFSEDSSGDIYFRASTDNGSTFSPTLATDATNLSSTDTIQSNDIQISANATNVYVAWEEGNTNNENVAFRASRDNGTTFVPDIGSTPTDLSTLNSGDGRVPDIFVSNNTIHSVFLDDDGFGRIKYRAITDNGDGTYSFSPTLANSATSLTDGTGIVQNPTIHANGTKVYAAWEELQIPIGNNEIFFTNSTDGGTTFNNPNNQSDDSDTSTSPKITSSGNNVYLIWSDTVAAGADIKMRASFSTSFADFGSITQITNDADTAQTPEIAASGSNVYVVWDDNGNDPDSGTDSEILFRNGTISSADITFNQTEYKLTETANITIDAPNQNTNASSIDQFDITITSSSSSGGITVNFTETGINTDSFTANITFNTSSSSGSSLLVAPGDTITATLDDQTGTASIFSRTVDFNGSSSFNLNSFATVRVVDQNSNTNTGEIEQIQVSVSSTNAANGSYNPITLTLNETGADTGIFLKNQFIFMNGYDAINFDTDITLRQQFDVASGSVNPLIIDTDTITVNTPSATNIGIQVTETGINTRILENQTKFIVTSTSGTSIQASAGDYFTITSSDGLTARGLLLPNSNSSNGALRTSLTDAANTDTITASYLGETGSVTLQYSGGEGGGGGGGIVRPGLVLNALAGISVVEGVLGGGGTDNSPPISTLETITKSRHIDVPDHIRDIVENHKPGMVIEGLDGESYDLPFAINEKKYPLVSNDNTINTNQVDVGEPVEFKMLFYEQLDLEHVSIYMNLRDGKRDHQSDTYIIFEKQKPIEIVDRNEFFEDVNVKIIEEEGTKKIAVFKIKFAKEMETSDIIYKAWDFKRRGTTIAVHDAFKVGETKIEETIKEIETKSEESKPPVPDWIKSNAKWWSEGGISDETFTNGIGYLISEKIIEVPTNVNESKEKDEEGKIIEEEDIEIEIPVWVKSNAQWWSEELLDEETFLLGIEYMVKQRIITIP